MNLSQTAGASALTAILGLLNSGTMVLYGAGPMPATPETGGAAPSGVSNLNTSWSFAASAAGSTSYNSGAAKEQAAANFASATVTPTTVPGSSATATFARCFKSDAATVVMDIPAADAWSGSRAVIVGQYVTNGGNVYRCTAAGTTASSGGPSGTGTGITDGSATWAYDSNATVYGYLALNNTMISNNVQQTASLTLSMPVV